MLAPLLIVIGLALIIFFIYTTARNAKSGNGNILQNVISSLSGSGSGSTGIGTQGSGTGQVQLQPKEGITPATPKPKLTSRFTNTPKSLGGPPKDSGINFADDFNFKDPNEGKSLFCRVTHLC